MLPSSDHSRRLPLLLAVLVVGGLALLALLWLRGSAPPPDPAPLTAVLAPDPSRGSVDPG